MPADSHGAATRHEGGQRSPVRQLEYGECTTCLGTGEIPSSWWQRKLLGFDDYYDCPICGGDGRHIGPFEFSQPEVYVRD